MMSTREILLEYVSPLLGAIFANLMFAAPLKDVHRAVKNGSLGHLNPTPWAVMTGNTLGWITYSYLLNNYFIFWANAPGFIFSIWLNMAAAKLQYCDRLADNMRSSFAELVESKRQSIHQSVYKKSLYQRSRRSVDFEHHVHEEKTNKMGCSTLDPDDSTIDLESTMKRTNRVPPLASPSRSERSNNPLDESTYSNQSVQSHHILEKLGELGTLAMNISTERMEAPAPHEKVVVSIIVLWFTFISCIIFIPMDTKQREFIVGILVNINMSFFYGAPLSIIWKVFKTKNSSWIHRQTMMMNTLCALFFMAFGFGRMDYFLIVPNGIGVVLGGVQLFLRMVVPNSDKAVESQTRTKQDNNCDVNKEEEVANKHVVESHTNNDDSGKNGPAVRLSSELSA